MSGTSPFNAMANIPGTSSELFPEQVTYLQGRVEKSQIYQSILSENTRDAQSSTTTNLRMGLLLGLNSSNFLTHFDPSGASSNSSLNCDMILATDLSMLNRTTAAKKFTGELYGGGIIDPNKIVLASSATVGIVGNDYEFHIRKQLTSGDFIMEDRLVECPLFSWRGEVAKTAEYTLTEADRDTLMTNEGAVGSVTFHLPAGTPKKDLAYYFYVMADQEVVVDTVAGDQIMTFNNASADSVSITTAGEHIGATFALIGDGTQWKMFNMSAGANTLTVTDA